MKRPRVGVILLLVTSACSHRTTTPATPHPLARPSQLVVLMLNMTNLALEWEFFDAGSDSIGAGTITARNASWCAKIPIPAAAETARLFNGLEDVALSPTSQPYWTLRMRKTNQFQPAAAAPC